MNKKSYNILSAKEKNHIAKAYFAGGCFWGVEYFFEHTDGIISAVSGYMGGSLNNPSYEDICHGATGHLEVVKITYDTKKQKS
jgi:peptide methionine sulfoxide reductase msrA/msrB